jgi:hypothetical protein
LSSSETLRAKNLAIPFVLIKKAKGREASLSDEGEVMVPGRGDRNRPGAPPDSTLHKFTAAGLLFR